MAWREFDGSKPPFLCPPKYYEEYYKPLIINNTKNWVDDQVINETIFDFVNGEFDFSDKFYETKVFKYLQYSLRQRYLLKSARIKYDEETMDIEVLKQILEDGLSLIDDMKSIWFWELCNHKSYGFVSKVMLVFGQTKLKSYYDGKFRPIFVLFKLKIEGTDSTDNDTNNNDNDNQIGNEQDIYSLSSIWSNTNESFWNDIDWEMFRKEDVDKFSIN